MRRLTFILAFTISSASAMGQGFWAPGACWVFEDVQANHVERFTYVGDSLCNGLNSQVCLFESCTILENGSFSCGNMNGPFYEFTSLQDDVVLSYGYPYPAYWDTLYWLGVPGDRWWGRGSDESCPAPAGMIEIQDTGHVIIEGILLRTWGLAWLDQNGIPWLPGGVAPVTIIERLGATPRHFCPAGCPSIADCYMLELMHYSDEDIVIPLGTTCDLATNAESSSPTRDRPSIYPSPGSDHLTINGLNSVPHTIAVQDPLGRLIHTQNIAASNTILETSAWPSGAYFITVTDQCGARQVVRWEKQ